MRAGNKGNIVLTSKDRKALEALVDRAGTPLRNIIRAWIILLSAADHPTADIAARLGVSASTVHYWRNRFIRAGFGAVFEQQALKRRRHDDAEIRKVIETTLKEWPARGRRWSIRNISKFLGISRSAVQRIWKSHGLKPYDEEFKFQHDDAFYTKARDVAGVYVASEEAFAVALLSEDVPSALSNMIESPAAGEPEPEILISRVFRIVSRRRPPQPMKPEFLDFLKWVDSHTPPRVVVHVIVPSRSRMLFPHAFRWLKRHPRFQAHVMPKDIGARKFLGDWYVKTLDGAKLSGGFPSLPDLWASLQEYLEIYARPVSALKRLPPAKPFLWVRPDRNYQADERQLELKLS